MRYKRNTWSGGEREKRLMMSKRIHNGDEEEEGNIKEEELVHMMNWAD